MVLELSTLPGSTQAHRWADWAELLCLQSGTCSAGDLQAAISNRRDNASVEETDLHEPFPIEDEAVVFTSEVDLIEDELNDEGEFGDREADINDRVSARVLEVFQYLRQRVESFGETYPFTISTNGRRLDLKPVSSLLGPRRTTKVYIFLLLCSAFRYLLDKKLQTDLAARYEHLCASALRRSLPSTAQVHIFGKSAAAAGGEFAAGTFPSKVERLAQMLGEESRLNPQKISHSTGDGGLDIVAWLATGDSQSGRTVFLGQCACTPDWVTKQSSVSDEAWYAKMTLAARPQSMCFIPYDFRDAASDWFRSDFIHRSVTVDRRRLLFLMEALDVASVQHDDFEDSSLRIDELVIEAVPGVDAESKTSSAHS